MRRDLFTAYSKTVGARVARAGLAMAAAATLASCTTAQKNSGVSPAYLVVDTLEGASGADPSKLTTVLNSDVLTNGGILQDDGRVTVHIELKDPGTANSPSQPSPANAITLSRYRVQYVRADGRNTPGVDVPYPFDGGLGVTVTSEKRTAAITLVRIQAKLEAPLLALTNHGGAVAISTIATVTFYGTDAAGREVSASANIGVNFADWADPKGGS
jgi:hypothetical protein